MTRSMHPPSRKHLVAAVLGAAAVLSLGMAITAPPAAAQITVFDPSNYSQNILTAARTLTQINNNIQSNTPGSWTDDGGAPLPTSIRRLREGIERFYITDINNPAGSAAAQSTIVAMFDAWAAGGIASWYPGALQAQASFNHIPGGSNVLFMDGHVEYIEDVHDRYPNTTTLIEALRALEDEDGQE